MSTESQTPIKQLSFEQALSELESIVRRLESGNIELEQAITLHERGSQLKAHCATKLNQAKLKVEKIIEKDGVATDTEATVIA